MRIPRLIAATVLAATFLAGCSAPTLISEPSPSAAPISSIPASSSSTPRDPELSVTHPDPAPDTSIPYDAGVVVDGLPTLNDSSASVISGRLPLDPNPQGDVTDLRLRVTDPIPAFAEPGAEPIGIIDPVTVWDETVLPVFETHPDDSDWAMVPIFARSGLPSSGKAGQAVAWVNLTDDRVVDFWDDRQVIIDLDTGSITPTVGSATETHSGLGVGAERTPTPVGRSAVAAIYTDESATYTAGLPIIALTRFSDTQDFFTPLGTTAGTQAPPLIAIHYHDVLGGQVSNGCIRVDARITDLAGFALPGTPVTVRG